MRPGQPTVAIDLLSALLLVVGVGIFVAGNAFREERIPAITAIGIPLSGLLPALFTVGNLVLAGVLLDDTAVPIVVVAAILLIALGADAVFVVYCRALLESFTATHVAPVPVGTRRGSGRVRDDHTAGYNHVEIFDTPWCRNIPRSYSR
jgi:hypothetical protein